MLREILQARAATEYGIRAWLMARSIAEQILDLEQDDSEHEQDDVHRVERQAALSLPPRR